MVGLDLGLDPVDLRRALSSSYPDKINKPGFYRELHTYHRRFRVVKSCLRVYAALLCGLELRADNESTGQRVTGSQKTTHCQLLCWDSCLVL